MLIRFATRSDRDDIHNVHLAAFDESEREIVAKLAVDLLGEETSPETILLVAEIDGAVAGHVAYSPVAIGGNEDFRGYNLAPLGVFPRYQKSGIGSELVSYGIQLLRERGVDILFVYGDPNYYGRFGFTEEAAKSYVPPYRLEFPFGWQAVMLGERRGIESPAGITFVASLSNQALW